MSTLSERLAAELRTVEQDALSTYVSFIIWLRWLRTLRTVLWLLGTVCGVVAASAALKADPALSRVAAIIAIGGAAFPALVKALKLDEAVAAYAGAVARLSNLRGEARRVTGIAVLEGDAILVRKAQEVFDAMASVRSLALTPPEPCFLLARRKIKRGDYAHAPVHDAEHATAGTPARSSADPRQDGQATA